MTLPALMNIQVGKRYLGCIKPIEKVCPLCGYVIGAKTSGEKVIVTVVKAIEGEIMMRCPDCEGTYLDNRDGWYQVKTDYSFSLFIAPYTQLSRIEEEDYD